MSLIIILLAIGSMLLFIAVRSLRAQRLKERYALLFLFLGLPFLLLAVWPDAIAHLAHWLEIQYQTVVLLGVTTFFLLLNLKLLSVVSIQDHKITTLAQMVAILKAKDGEGGTPDS